MAITVLPKYIYSGKVVRVIDGDTLEAEIDLGFYVRITVHLRLFGINCPELSTPEGKVARDYVTTRLRATPDITAVVYKPDKYGDRWDAAVYVNSVSLNDELVTLGYAVKKIYQLPETETDHAEPRAHQAS